MKRSLREAAGYYLVDRETRLGKAVNMTLIFLNMIFIALYVVSTFQLSEQTREIVRIAELILVGVFIVEYSVRLDEAESTLREALSPYTLIDFIVLAPEILILFLPFPQIGFLKVLRVLRIFRFLRFLQDEEFFFGRINGSTLRRGRLLLSSLSVFFITAGFFYEVEKGVNPGVQNFWDAFYFAVISITTTGYGDITPMTTLGRLASLVGVVGGLVVVRAWLSRLTGRSQKRRGTICPRCKLTEHEADAHYCKRCGEELPLEPEVAEQMPDWQQEAVDDSDEEGDEASVEE